MSIALYEICDDYLREFERLIDEPDQQKAQDILECIQGALQEKASNVALFLRNKEAVNEAIDTEIERLKKLRERNQTGIDKLKSYLAVNMQRTGIKRVDHPLVTIKFAKNPPSVDVLCEAQIPPKYWVQPPPPDKKLDKKAIAADLKAGQDVPGAQLKTSERLVIE